MKRYKIKSSFWTVILISGLCFLCAAIGMADDDHGFKKHFERKDRHSIPFLGSDDEGSETVGQIAAWLLLVANLPVALSLLVKGANRFAPLGTESKKTLANLNRLQKPSCGCITTSIWGFLALPYGTGSLRAASRRCCLSLG